MRVSDPMRTHKELALKCQNGKGIRRGIPTDWKDMGRDVWKLIECATPKVKSRAIDVRVLCAGEIFTRFLSEAKLLKGMVARDGIEPPTPAFSGPRSTN